MADEYVYLARGTSIAKVRCVKVNRASVLVEIEKFRLDGNILAYERHDRVSPKGRYFDTWEEARAHLDNQASERVAEAREQLQEALRAHEVIALLREP